MDLQSDNRPIGVFDSGVGGLTVLRELIKAFPLESFIYLGDTARLPYGTKSPETVRKYSEQNMKYLIKRNVKALVVACNTASTQVSEKHFENLPVYNVIDPGSLLASKTTENNKVGIIATRATVNAQTYTEKIKFYNPDIEVYSTACPLFVPLAEEGWHEDPITNLIAYRYLNELKNKEVDTVVMGCTHYPLLKSAIARVFGPYVQLIDSGEAIAYDISIDFAQGRIKKSSLTQQQIYLCQTDVGSHFENLALSLLNGYVQNEIRFETVSVI